MSLFITQVIVYVWRGLSKFEAGWTRKQKKQNKTKQKNRGGGGHVWRAACQWTINGGRHQSLGWCPTINTIWGCKKKKKSSLCSHNFTNMDCSVFLCHVNVCQNWLWNCNDSCHVQILLKNKILTTCSNVQSKKHKECNKYRWRCHDTQKWSFPGVYQNWKQWTLTDTTSAWPRLAETMQSQPGTSLSITGFFSQEVTTLVLSSENAQHNIHCNTLQYTFSFRVLES